MGREKLLMDYHGQPQGLVAFERLSAVCERVFLSCRAEQFEETDFANIFQAIPLIEDAYGEVGPLAGLLSAMEMHPKMAWLVLACDMPLVDDTVINTLLSGRDPKKWATVFKSPVSHLNQPFFEPLCAIYEPACRSEFQRAVREERTGLQALLSDFEQKDRLAVMAGDKVIRDGNNLLQNANTPHEAQRFLVP